MMKSLKRLARGLSGQKPSTGVRASAQGDAARDRGAWGEAADHYISHLKAHPADFPYWVQLGHAYKETGRYEDAEAAYASASRLNPDDADLQLCRGHLAKLRDDLDGAIRFYNLSFSLDGNPHAAREMGNPDLIAHAQSQHVAPPMPLHISGAVERLSGTVLSGWVLVPRGSRSPRVEVLVDQTVIALGQATAGRVEHIGQTVGLFSIDLSGLIDFSDSPLVHVRDEDTEEPLMGSPFVLEQSPEIRAWLTRHDRLSASALDRRREDAAKATKGQTMAFLIDLDDAAPAAVQATLQSLDRQWSPDWTATLILNSAAPARTRKIVRDASAKDRRFTALERTSSLDQPTWPDAIHALAPDLIMVVEPGIYLEPELVLRFLETASIGDADAIYADEATTGKTHESIEHVIARGAFSLDATLSSPHLVAPMAFRSAILGHVAMERAAGLTGVALGLRIVQASRSIAHVPGILVRRPSAHDQQIESSITEFMGSMSAALSCRAVRKGPSRPLTWRIDMVEAGGRTLVVVIDRSTELRALRRTIDTLLKTTLRSRVDISVISISSAEGTHTHMSRLAGQIDFVPVESDGDISQAITALASKHAVDYEFVVLVDAGTTFGMASWLDDLSGIIARPDVGIVAPLLVDTSDAIVSAGIVFDRNARIHHRHKGDLPAINGKRQPGHLDDLFGVRNVSAVSGACAMLKMKTLVTLALDPDLPSREIVPDLSVRIGRDDLQVLVEPDVSVTVGPMTSVDEQRTSLGFTDKWATQMSVGDPFYSPLLSDKFDFSYGHLERMTAAVRTRSVRPAVTNAHSPKERQGTISKRIRTPRRAPP